MPVACLQPNKKKKGRENLIFGFHVVVLGVRIEKLKIMFFSPQYSKVVVVLCSRPGLGTGGTRLQALRGLIGGQIRFRAGRA